MWILLPLIPLVIPVPSTTAVVAMLAVLIASNLLANMGIPAWYTWMGDLIPRRIRGRYLARRDRWCKAVQVVAVIAVGYITDRARTVGAAETMQAQPGLMITIGVILSIATVFGVIDVLMFHRIREILPTVADRPRRPAVDIRVAGPSADGLVARLAYAGRYAAAAGRQVLIEPMKERSFRYYVGYGLLMTFAMTVGGWYFWLLAMEHLGFSNLATMALFMAVAPVAGILSSVLWGRLIDRWGRRPVLMVATAGVVLSVMPWFVATATTPCPAFLTAGINWLSVNVGGWFGRPVELVGPRTPIGAFMLIFFSCVLGGACWQGVFLAQTGIMLGFADGAGRSKHVAAAAVLISTGGIMGGLFGGVVTQWLHTTPQVAVGPFGWINWHAAIAMSLAGRVMALFLAGFMPDPGSGRVRDMFRLFRLNVYSAIAPRLLLPLRMFGRRRWPAAARQSQRAEISAIAPRLLLPLRMFGRRWRGNRNVRK